MCGGGACGSVKDTPVLCQKKDAISGQRSGNFINYSFNKIKAAVRFKSKRMEHQREVRSVRIPSLWPSSGSPLGMAGWSHF